jgi:hypothetical protein
MATEILVNDGGAPARILPFTAEAAISAGEAVTAGAADGGVILATQANLAPLGYALTDAAADAPVSVITGKGVILSAMLTDHSRLPTDDRCRSSRSVSKTNSS